MSSAQSFYLKFDLTKTSLKGLPELEKISQREGAIRTCLILNSSGSWSRSDHLEVARTADSRWNVIKIPSIEGTELWIVPESSQLEVERRVGFEKPSAPLLRTEATHFMKLSCRDPIHRNEIRLEWRSTPAVSSCTGLSVLMQTGPFSAEHLETTRDRGSIAFEE